MWKNPILPGYNADPQIAMFGGKFYIYPTTDGFANWLGANFHAWSSPDLVKWTDEGVVLDPGSRSKLGGRQSVGAGNRLQG